MDFADELAYALLTNGLRDQDRPSRSSERLAMDATNPPYKSTMLQPHTFRNNTLRPGTASGHNIFAGIA